MPAQFDSLYPCCQPTGSSIGQHNEADAMTKQEAIILDDHGRSIEGRRIAKILDFLGVVWRSATTELLTLASADREIRSQWRLFCSSDILLHLIERCERDSGYLRLWEDEVHSVFMYAGDDPEVLSKLMRRLTKYNGAVVSRIRQNTEDIRCCWRRRVPSLFHWGTT